jgi:endoglucanase
LQAHSSIVPPGGFVNPSGTGTGGYGDGDDSDERLWAAAEVYLATGDATAKSYFESNYASKGVITGTMNWGWVRPLAELTYLRGSRTGISPSIQTSIRQSLLTYCSSLQSLRDNSGFRSALNTGNYNWGSNSQALNNAVLLIVGAEEGGSALYKQSAIDQLHYVLGCNVIGQSFVTGLGAKHTMHPHHRPSASDGIVEPVPGLLSGGPDHSINDDPVLPTKFTSSTPPAQCYVDDQGSYASNEIAINWNAPLVFVAGYAAAIPSNTSVLTPVPTVPDGIKLNQNYPNPFNGQTTFSFTLKDSQNVQMTLVDVLGRTVVSRRFGVLSAGSHQFTLDASSLGKPIASGSYLYFLESNGVKISEVRSCVLIR